MRGQGCITPPPPRPPFPSLPLPVMLAEAQGTLGLTVNFSGLISPGGAVLAIFLKNQHAQSMQLLHLPPGLCGLAYANCSAPQGKLLPHAEVHEVWLVMQLLKDDVLPLPLVQ